MISAATRRVEQARERTRLLRRAWDLYVTTGQLPKPLSDKQILEHQRSFKAGFDAAGAPETFGIIATDHA